ncbi:MAG: hypothetical protein WAM16_09380 [Nitrososphaeraceae archaeon]
MKPSFSEWSESDDEPYEDNEPIRKRILRKGVGVIEMEYSEDQMIAYCPHCKQAGFRVRLDPKILMPGETRQPEYESWWECKDCHEIVAAYVVEHDGTIITNAVETVESPYENQTEIMGIPKRSSPAGQKAAAKRKRNRNKMHEDPEIDALMRIYGDRVTVHTEGVKEVKINN